MNVCSYMYNHHINPYDQSQWLAILRTHQFCSFVHTIVTCLLLIRLYAAISYSYLYVSTLHVYQL